MEELQKCNIVRARKNATHVSIIWKGVSKENQLKFDAMLDHYFVFDQLLKVRTNTNAGPMKFIHLS